MEKQVAHARRMREEQWDPLHTLSDDRDFPFGFGSPVMPEQTEYNYGVSGSMAFMENYHGKDYWD